jgi:hypothetical protein
MADAGIGGDEARAHRLPGETGRHGDRAAKE